MKDPERLIISEDNELGVALAAARRQMPDEDRLAMLAERLAQAGVPVPRESLGTSAAPRADVQSGLRWGPLLKVGLGIAFLGVLGGVSVWHSRETPSPDAQTFNGSGVVASQTAASAEGERVSPSRPIAKDAPVNAPALAAAPPRRGANQPIVELPSEVETLPEAATSVAARSVAKAAPTVVSADAPARPLSGRPAPARALPSTDFADADLQESSESELELLKQARSAVSSDPLRAYALTERSRARYPNAVLAQERDFIAVSALFRIGREQQARAQAISFRSRYPRSAYLPQIARMLGEE